MYIGTDGGPVYRWSRLNEDRAHNWWRSNSMTCHGWVSFPHWIYDYDMYQLVADNLLELL